MQPKAIILTTYHINEDIVDECISVLAHLWPKHPPIIVISDTGNFTFKNRIIIDSPHWTKVLSQGLEKAIEANHFTEDDYILLLLEDHIPLRSLPLENLERALQFAQNEKLQHLALFGHGKGELIHQDESLQIYQRVQGYKFYTELHPAFWNTGYLRKMLEQSLINKYLNPWQFEQQEGLEAHYTTNLQWTSRLGGFLVGGHVDQKSLKEMNTPTFQPLKKKLRNRSIKALPKRLLKKLL